MLHRGERRAQTAEQLMRSRYAAYALGEVDYLIATHPEAGTPPAQRRRALQLSCQQTRWQELRILAVEDGGLQDLTGSVSFEARFRAAGQERLMRERSWFERRDGHPQGDWLYLRALA